MIQGDRRSDPPSLHLGGHSCLFLLQQPFFFVPYRARLLAFLARPISNLRFGGGGGGCSRGGSGPRKQIPGPLGSPRVTKLVSMFPSWRQEPGRVKANIAPYQDFYAREQRPHIIGGAYWQLFYTNCLLIASRSQREVLVVSAPEGRSRPDSSFVFRHITLVSTDCLTYFTAQKKGARLRSCAFFSSEAGR